MAGEEAWWVLQGVELGLWWENGDVGGGRWLFGWPVGILAMRGFDRVGVSPDIEKSSVENSCPGEGGSSFSLCPGEGGTLEFGEAILEMTNR